MPLALRPALRVPNPLRSTRLQDKGGQVANVRAFGAVGDGSTDDSIAILAAQISLFVDPATGLIDTQNHYRGGTLYFPPGLYRVMRQLVYLDGVTWAGASNGTSAIYWAVDSDLAAGFALDALPYNATTGWARPALIAQRFISNSYSLVLADSSHGLAAGTYSITLSGASAYFRDLKLSGPGGGLGGYGKAGSLSFGLALDAGAKVRRLVVQNWFAGICLPKDHNEVFDCTTPNNFFGVYYMHAPTSGGNIYHYDANYGGCYYASVACAGDNQVSGGGFLHGSIGPSPIALYRFDKPLRVATDAAIAASSTSLSSTNLAFTGADVGRLVWIFGAGPSGALLQMKIASVAAGVATLTANDADAQTTVSQTQASTTVTNALAIVFAPATVGWMVDMIFDEANFEGVGNAAILDDSRAGTPSTYSVIIRSAGYSYDPARLIPGKARDWTVRLYQAIDTHIWNAYSQFLAGTEGVYYTALPGGLDIEIPATLPASIFGHLTGTWATHWSYFGHFVRSRTLGWVARACYSTAGQAFVAGEVMEQTPLGNNSYVQHYTVNTFAGIVAQDTPNNGGTAVTVLVYIDGIVTAKCPVASMNGLPLVPNRTTPTQLSCAPNLSYSDSAPGSPNLPAKNTPVVATTVTSSNGTTASVRLVPPPGVPQGAIYAAAAPTTGTWALGDIVWNSAPASAGFAGWVCTAAGTPGSWKTFGLIS